MDKGLHIVASSELGRVGVSTEAIQQIIGHVAEEAYGVVEMAGRKLRLRPRDPLTSGIDVRRGADGLQVTLHVVIEYGLNLAEIASTLRSRVAYELERQTGLTVAAVDVRIDDVRRST